MDKHWGIKQNQVFIAKRIKKACLLVLNLSLSNIILASKGLSIDD